MLCHQVNVSWYFVFNVVHSKGCDALTQWHCVTSLMEALWKPETLQVRLCWMHFINMYEPFLVRYCYPILSPFHCPALILSSQYFCPILYPFHCPTLTLSSPVLLPHVELISLSCINPFKSSILPHVNPVQCHALILSSPILLSVWTPPLQKFLQETCGVISLLQVYHWNIADVHTVCREPVILVTCS